MAKVGQEVQVKNMHLVEVGWQEGFEDRLKMRKRDPPHKSCTTDDGIKSEAISCPGDLKLKCSGFPEIGTEHTTFLYAVLWHQAH